VVKIEAVNDETRIRNCRGWGNGEVQSQTNWLGGRDIHKVLNACKSGCRGLKAKNQKEGKRRDSVARSQSVKNFLSTVGDVLAGE